MAGRSGAALPLALAAGERSGRPGPALAPFLRSRLCELALSPFVSAAGGQLGGLRCLDLDGVERRFLLAGAADSTIEAFDVLAADDGGGHAPVQLEPLFSIKRGHASAHRYQVTSLAWYPVDTGLFVTGSADMDVKVWDTNTLQMAASFSCPDKVLALGMSSAASSHALIAVGTKKPGLMLADVLSGAFTHTLDGHSNGAWAVAWSPANEHQLWSGDGGGTVRLWDVRRAGCVAQLDMHATERQPAAAAAAAPHNGSTTGSGRKRRQPGASASAGRAARDASPPPPGAAFAGAALAASPRPRPLAHEGAVTGMLPAADGLALLTAGADSRVRAWDAQLRHHLLTHFPDTLNRGAFPKRLAGSPDGRVLFCPRGNDVQVFDVVSGRQLALLSQGHYDTVTGCAYSPLTGHLWSCGLDGALLAWAPKPRLEPPARAAGGQAARGHAADWWLAAAAGGRGRAAAGLGGLGAAAGGGAAAGAAVGQAVAPLADVDHWSDDDEALIG